MRSTLHFLEENLAVDEHHSGGGWFGLVCVAICVVVNVINIPRAIVHRKDPTRHPSVRALLPAPSLTVDHFLATVAERAPRAMETRTAAAHGVAARTLTGGLA